MISLVQRFASPNPGIPIPTPSGRVEHLKTYAQTDHLLRQFIPFVRQLGYWTFITADHGMHADPDPEAKEPGTHGNDQPVDTLVPLWLVPPA